MTFLTWQAIAAISLLGGGTYTYKQHQTRKHDHILQVDKIFTQGAYTPNNAESTQQQLACAIEDIEKNCIGSFKKALESGNYHEPKVQAAIAACNETKNTLKQAFNALATTKNPKINTVLQSKNNNLKLK